MNGTNDCLKYIDKVTSFATNSPDKLVISASAGGLYTNTNYYFDNTRTNIGLVPNVDGLNASNAVVNAGAAPASVIYTNVTDSGLGSHITRGSNVAGYLSFGKYSSLGPNYATNSAIQWSGNSGCWIIETVESFNGLRIDPGYGTFIKWFSSNAFGGTDYSNTPIGAVSHVDEPFEAGVNDAAIYFGSWAAGKNFAICAWASRLTPYFQAVGDPFVAK